MIQITSLENLTLEDNANPVIIQINGDIKLILTEDNDKELDVKAEFNDSKYTIEEIQKVSELFFTQMVKGLDDMEFPEK